MICRHREAQIDSPNTEIDRFLRSEFHDRTLGPFIPKASAHHAVPLRSIPFPFEDLTVPTELYYPGSASPQLVTQQELFGYLNTWSASKRFFDTHGYQPTDDIVRSIAALWPAEAMKSIRWPVECRMGRKAVE